MAKVYVLYHFLHPDRVVSAVHFSELVAGLVDRGWHVTAFTSNRKSDGKQGTYPPGELWRGARIRRIWRPAWRQSQSAGRVLNAVWIIFAWSALTLRFWDVPDVVIMGTDPIFSVLIAPVWRLLHPQVKIVHWCFDLYPEAAYADGLLRSSGLLGRVLRFLLRHSYGACDLIADIGPCMKQLLLQYGSALKTDTLVPWALSEPSYPMPVPEAERKAIFGSVGLALMYSGSFGRAHNHEDMLGLARHMQGDSVHLALSVKGNRVEALRAAINESDTNVSLVPFASDALLEQRLASADIHVISLREEWTGTVVPSKSFGALAIGRPLLFCGSRSSDIARWIEEYGLGWVLEAGDAATIAADLRRYMQDAQGMLHMRDHCYRIYQAHFSREVTLDKWNRQLANLLSSRLVA